MAKYSMLDSHEAISFLITIFLGGFILSFNGWGTESFDFSYGLRNLVLTTIILAVSFLIKLSVQKHLSYKSGFEVKYRPWYLGFVLGIIFIFITNGKLIFLAFGGLVFHLAEKMRIGHEEHYLSFSQMGWISAAGPITNMVIASAGSLLAYTSLDPIISSKIISINIWLALFGMLPIPFVHKFRMWQLKKYGEFGTSDGLKLFYASPFEYLIILVLMFVDIFAILLLSGETSVYIVIVSLVLMWLVYYLFYKQNITKKGDKSYMYRFE